MTLTFSESQLTTFGDGNVASFIDAMVPHLAEYAPEHHEVLGDEGQRDLIEMGLRESELFEFTTWGPLQLYLEAMHLFGCGFATDPMYPWAAEALAEPGADEQSRANLLHAAIVRWLKDVGGEGAANTIDALRRSKAMARTEVSDIYDLDSEAVLTDSLRAAFPGKVEAAGEGALQKLIERSGVICERHDLTEGRGWGLIVTFMFGFGARFDEDPIFPWVRTALERDEPADKRLHRLKAQGATYLELVTRRLDN